MAAIYGRLLENAQSVGCEPFPNRRDIRAVIEKTKAEEDQAED